MSLFGAFPNVSDVLSNIWNCTAPLDQRLEKYLYEPWLEVLDYPCFTK